MAKGPRKSALTELVRSGLVGDGELLRYKVIWWDRSARPPGRPRRRWCRRPGGGWRRFTEC